MVETYVLDDSLESDSSSGSESKIPPINLVKRQSPMIHILLTMTKAAAVPLAVMITIDSTVSEMHLS